MFAQADGPNVIIISGQEVTVLSPNEAREFAQSVLNAATETQKVRYEKEYRKLQTS